MLVAYREAGDWLRREQEAGSIRGTLSPRSFRDSRARFHPGRTSIHSERLGVRKKHRPYTHGLVLIFISLAVGYATFAGGAFGARSHAFAAPITGLSLPGVSASVQPSDELLVRGNLINKTLRQDPAPTKSPQDSAKLVSAERSAAPTAQPAVAAQEDAVVRAASVAPTPDTDPFHIYRVQDGDTVGSIATKFHISSKYILANNAEIRDSDFLKLDQSIIVPASDGILHQVRLGQTLSEIAGMYQVTDEAITGYSGNHIAKADDITERQMIFVPNGAVPTFNPVGQTAPSPTGTPTVAATPGNGDSADASSTPSDTPTATSTSDSSGSGSIVGGGESSGHGLIWPVVGPISSYYGPSHPLGIDVDGFNLTGAPIAAATSGTVVFAGGNSCCSYGLYVVVMSPGGIETLYGHLSVISVSQGETVSRGEQLGIIGNTGYSTGTHLHFEVIDNGTRENPISYLP